MQARYEPARTFPARGKVVLPGLINTHLHHTQQLARGLADECGIERWLVERIYPYESVMTAEEARVCALAGHLDMIKNGTSTYIDPGGYYPDETAKVTGESGLRGILTRSTLDVHSSLSDLFQNTEAEDTDQALKGAKRPSSACTTLSAPLRAWSGSAHAKLLG